MGAPTAYRDTGVPNLSFSGYDGLGPAGTYPQFGAVNSFQYADTLTYIRGNHSFDFGADIRPIKRGNFFQDIEARDAYSFNGVATGSVVFAGLPLSAQAALPVGLCAQRRFEELARERSRRWRADGVA